MVLGREEVNVRPLMSPEYALKQDGLEGIFDSWLMEAAAALPSMLEF